MIPKCRVWDGEKMVYDVGFTPEGITYTIPKHAENSDQFDYYPDCPVMISTGVNDKNGKEIYEGDVVRFLKKNVQVGTRRKMVGRRYESYGIYEDREIIGVIEKGTYRRGIRKEFIPCLMVNTDETTTYEHYFWGEGKRTDKPTTAVDNLSEPLYTDKEYEVIGNVCEKVETS